MINKELLKHNINTHFNWAVGHRRHLHQHPELSFEEYQTSAYIASVLDEIGIPYNIVAETGILAVIEGGEKGKSIGLRAAKRQNCDCL